jgi:hypothetical protein
VPETKDLINVLRQIEHYQQGSVAGQYDKIVPHSPHPPSPLLGHSELLHDKEPFDLRLVSESRGADII